MMRSYVSKAAPVAALLLCFAGGPQLFAQWRHGGDGRGDDRGYGYGGGSPVDRAMSDLQRASRNSGDRKHVDSAMHHLQRFQASSVNGRFDKDRLDGAIEDIQHLVNSNQINPRDRQVLNNDLSALRAFRSSGGYNGRGYNNGRYNNGRYPYNGGYGPYGRPY
jgi:hypothetical protein